MPTSVELTVPLHSLVATLAAARELAVRVGRGEDDARPLLGLVAQARATLDLADERLLALDRYRRRSAFRQAQRIRTSLDRLEEIVADLPAHTVPEPASPLVAAA